MSGISRRPEARKPTISDRFWAAMTKMCRGIVRVVREIVEGVIEYLIIRLFGALVRFLKFLFLAIFD